MSTSDKIRRAVDATYPSEDRKTVLDLLGNYDGNEPERVQLAVLALANGSTEEVRRMAEVARCDYRDVLFWAEYPEESQSPISTEEMAERYRVLTRSQP